MPRFPRYNPPFQYYSPYNYRPRTPSPEPVTNHITPTQEKIENKEALNKLREMVNYF